MTFDGQDDASGHATASAEGDPGFAAGGETPEALLAAVATGDRAAFRRLYDLTSPKLMGVALRLLRRRDVAEDALQDAYLRIWARAGQFDPARGAAWHWLARIVRNAALDQRQRQGPTHDDLADHAERLAGAAPPAGARLDLARGLEALGPRQREAVLLAHMHGYTHDELAARMGAPLGTAKTWARRGADRLRARLSA